MPSCLWASLVFFLSFHKFAFNFGPGVIACIIGTIFLAFFGRTKASAKRARSTSPVACVWLSSLVSACLSWPEKLELTSPVMQATGVKEIGPIMLVS